jgi:two-component sensor histidine kinase/PAS domain-containing protein
LDEAVEFDRETVFPIDKWREANRYRRSDSTESAVISDIERRLAGLNFLKTPVWVFDAQRCQCLWANTTGLAIWQAKSVDDLLLRNVAATQSEAVYALLNDYLHRAAIGEDVACWVTLDPAGTTRRFYQSHHFFVLSDGRGVLLIEAQVEPPAEEMLAFAANHAITIGLYEMDGHFVSGNPGFVKIAEKHPLHDLNAIIPPGHQREHWPSLLEQQSTVGFEVELNTERGQRWFRGELRRVWTHARTARTILSLFDLTDERFARTEIAHRKAVTRSLREKEILLHEIHHRVQNNLQIISSLLMLQTAGTNDTRTQSLLRESANRVISMALIHGQIYDHESLDRIDLAEYTRRLVGSLRGLYLPNARVEVRSAPIEVVAETAVPLGLILNELITNAFKYGIPSLAEARPEATRRTGPGCDILIEIDLDGDTLRIVVTDSGPGLPEGINPTSTTTLGLHLVRTLTRQLRGKLTMTSEGGTRVELVCRRINPSRPSETPTVVPS